MVVSHTHTHTQTRAMVESAFLLRVLITTTISGSAFLFLPISLLLNLSLSLSLMLTITRGRASLPSSLHFAPNHLQLNNFSLKTFPLFLIYTEPMTSSFSPSPSLYSKPNPYPWWNLCLVFIVICGLSLSPILGCFVLCLL